MLIDLSGNENPYRREHEINGFENINRYIELKDVDKLSAAISEYSGCEKKRILIGAGTDSLIQKVLQKYNKGRELYVINPNSYGFVTFGKDIGMKIRRIQLMPPDFKIDWCEYDIKDAIIVIDYPNNPTGGLLISEPELKHLLKDNIVIIDEAGFEYSGKSFSNIIGEYGNLCILRTFDKALGLAGIKAGYAVMGDELLKKINMHHEINRPSAFICLKALNDKEYLKRSVEENEKEKTRLTEKLRELAIKVYTSEANYLLVNTDITDLGLKLRKNGIVIEDLSPHWLKDYYRITIGSKEENNELIKAIKMIIY